MYKNSGQPGKEAPKSNKGESSSEDDVTDVDFEEVDDNEKTKK